MKIKIKMRNEDYEPIEHEVIGKYEVCPRCAGEGTRVNPSVDGHRLTAEELNEDPEFAEAYFAGHYDVTCYECKGKRVVPVPDVDAFTSEQKIAWNQEMICRDEDARFNAEEEAERRIGA